MAKFEIKELNYSEASHDGHHVHNGDLYMDGQLLTRFTEHPIEGGYYPCDGNAIVSDAFLTAAVDFTGKEKTLFMGRVDDLELFDSVISKCFRTGLSTNAKNYGQRDYGDFEEI